MATTTTAYLPKSRSQPAICLADWWLAKAEDDVVGTTLAVAGQTDTVAGTKPTRFCSSLPILKRHDFFNLETTDGKCVILKGFMNKARSEENGFPSHVCNHFMFGFPQYWKECTERYMVKEPPSDILLPKSDRKISDSENKSNTSCSASGSKKSRYRNSIVDDCTAMNTMKSLTTSSSGEKINILDGVDKMVEDSQVHDSPLKGKFGRGMNSPEISSHTKNKARTHSVSKLEMIQKNGGEKIRLNSVSLSLDFDKVELARGESNLGGKNDLHVEDNTRLNESNIDKRNSSELVDAGSVEQIPETSKLEKDLERVQTRSVKQKAKSKTAIPLSKPISADDEKCTAVSEQILETSNLEKDLERVQTRGVKQKAKSKAATPLSKPISADDEKCTAVSEQIPETSNLEKDLERVQTRGVKQKAKSKAATPLSKPISADDEKCTAVSEQIPETSKLEKDLERVQTRGVKQKAKSKEATPLRKPISADDEKCSAVSEKIPETSNLEKDLERVQTKVVEQKAKSKAATPLSKPVTADDEKCTAVSDRINLSENNAKAPYTRRKLAYETPKTEKKKAPVDSPQSSSFKRSRSGRLLMPKLDFWRNQRAIYNADGTVTGIKDDKQLEQPIN